MPRNDGSEQAELNESNLFEIQKLKAENEALKEELRGERERLLLEMYNNDTISQVQFDHAMKALVLLT